MPNQCAVGRAGTVPGRTEAPSYMNYSSSSSGRASQLSTTHARRQHPWRGYGLYINW